MSASKYHIYLQGTLVHSGDLKSFLADHPEMTEADLFPTEGLAGSPGGEFARGYVVGEFPLRWVFSSGRPPREWWAVPAEEDETVYVFYFRDYPIKTATLEEFLASHQDYGHKLWWDRKLSTYVDVDGKQYPSLTNYFQTFLAPKGLRLEVLPPRPGTSLR